MHVRITTWNLQGREGPDLDDVAASITRLGPHVVVLQEVQRRQAAALATRLGWNHRWWFKHWTVVYPAEGLTILTPSPIVDAERVHLAHRWRFWSWRRRIATLATVDGVRLANVHLGAGVGDGERTRQAMIVLRALDGASPAVIAGDCNTAASSSVMAAFASAGFADAWGSVHPEAHGATNWRSGPRTDAPTQRLDYVLADESFAPVDAVVGNGAESIWADLGRLSDHAPVTATLARGDLAAIVETPPQKSPQDSQ